MPKAYVIGEQRRLLVLQTNGEYFVTIKEIGSPKSVTFPAKRWARLIQLLPQIENGVNCLHAKQFVDFKLHIGGAYFVSVASGYNCVDLREFYFHSVKGAQPRKVPGIALRLPEWQKLKELLPLLNKKFPDLANATPCDHPAYDVMLRCIECQPFQDKELSHSLTTQPFVF